MTSPDAGLPPSIGAPATRALTAAGYTRLGQLADVPAADLEKLHGVGPRSKSRSDEQVLEAALAIVRSGGVDRLTFAALAERCGLSAATLVQRFGTKPALTQRTLLHAWDELQARTLELASSVPKTPDGAVELLVGLSHYDGAVEDFAEGLLVLREDLRDPVLRRRGAAWETTLTTAIGECFASVPGNPGGIGFALAAHWQGALIWWAFGAQCPLDDYLGESLRTLISILLRSPRPHQQPEASSAWRRLGEG